jgi:hypothetical protein
MACQAMRCMLCSIRIQWQPPLAASAAVHTADKNAGTQHQCHISVVAANDQHMSSDTHAKNIKVPHQIQPPETGNLY